MATVRDAIVDTLFAAVPVAIVYFSGWAFLSSYLNKFGIDATQVSIPLTTVLVYAFRPLSSPSIILPFAVVVLVAQIVAVHRSLRSFAAATSLILTFGLGIIGLFAIKWESEAQAQVLAKSVWQGERPKTQAATSEQGRDRNIDAEYRQCQTDERLEQIIGFPDQVYLLCRHHKFPCEYGTVFLINDDGVIVLRQSVFRRDASKQEVGCEPLRLD